MNCSPVACHCSLLFIPTGGASPAIRCIVQAMQRLREEWQVIVVERLMHVKDAYGMPLARRQHDEARLTTLRSGASCASERIGVQEDAAAAADGGGMHVVTIELLLRAVVAAGCGRSIQEVLDGRDPNVRPPADRGGRQVTFSDVFVGCHIQKESPKKPP